mmetsp:Transcript_14084/g.36373  ORF Transcript_14084/g.36373 Transcript_14084/m.36373 type:complete len:492 (+) Transcript_14084:3-1478(+)
MLKFGGGGGGGGCLRSDSPAARGQVPWRQRQRSRSRSDRDRPRGDYSRRRETTVVWRHRENGGSAKSDAGASFSGRRAAEGDPEAAEAAVAAANDAAEAASAGCIKGVRWIATANRNYSLCTVDANEVPLEMMQVAKAIANNILCCDSNVDQQITRLPHELDGGWPGVHPDDAFVCYAQLQSGDYSGVSAMATGSPKVKRERALALALVISAAIEHHEKFTDEDLLKHHKDLPAWVAEGKRRFNELEARTDNEEELEPDFAGAAAAAADMEHPPPPEDRRGHGEGRVGERGRDKPPPRAPPAAAAAAARVEQAATASSSSSSSGVREVAALRQELQQSQHDLEVAESVVARNLDEYRQEEQLAQRQRFAESSYQQTARQSLQDLREVREASNKKEADLRSELEAARQQIQDLEASTWGPATQHAASLRSDIIKAEHEEAKAAAEEEECARRKEQSRELVASLTAELHKVKVEEEEEDPLHRAASAGAYARC